MRNNQRKSNDTTKDQDWRINIEQLEQECEDLEKRIRVLEDTACLNQTRQNRTILCKIVKDARIKILECNDLAVPTSKENWHDVLDSITRPQLVKAKVPLKFWPQLKEILSPSSMMLNEWVNGALQGDLESIINEMSVENQLLWKELYKIIK
ncbi:hypothetical protein M758_12G047200 [Ceratodon purpureus]|uniref:Uncharacterized protein n=1 Tax=Ceratodon purpureus TaxID=3225 RepID=A0A8T0G3J2_CERPU|nr:hypothetical protein KC19_12G044600 [Ceratodon purpureus]KAG0598111.1 hypothetical protein M758_12G047200 [Ceratodon purpureus]